ncbi:DNA repair protein RecO [bacterium]|nr:DNA repair protein RecO [bacterium]
MSILATDAIVLHAFDYRETSRIVRLATRDAGVVSAIARGARRPKSKFGSAFDLFTSGVAQLAMHPTGDLHALNAFDTTRTRPQLGASLGRFGAAEALSEVCMRFGQEDDSGRVFEAAERALDKIGQAAPEQVAEAAMAGLWHFVAGLGFAPSLDACASCHAPLDAEAPVTFHHRAGGALCPACARRAAGGVVGRARQQDRRALRAFRKHDHRVELHAVAHRDHLDALDVVVGVGGRGELRRDVRSDWRGLRRNRRSEG